MSIRHLYSITTDKDIPVKILLELFDSFVSSILGYAAEVWVFSKADNLEIIHRTFLIRVLGVKESTNTNSNAIHGELGSYKLICQDH